jgi:conjugative transfer signal peptidase TraF
MTEIGAIARIGAAMRADRARRRRLCRGAASLGALALALGATLAVPPRPLLVWNASASAPLGLYGVTAPTALQSGDMVIARLPEPMRMLAARRHYLPANIPLVKRVAAEPGDLVCADGASILINGRRVVTRLRHDAAGRPLPWWQGCATLRRGAIFLLMTGQPASFDGRYFGPTTPDLIVGKAHLLWAR